MVGGTVRRLIYKGNGKENDERVAKSSSILSKFIR